MAMGWTWTERKKERTEHFFKYIYKNKLKTCTACNGSGYYDTMLRDGTIPQCGCCNGTGKMRERATWIA